MKMTPFRALLIAVVVVAAAVWISIPQAHATLQAQLAQQGGRTASNSQKWVYRVDPVPAGGPERMEQLLNQRAGEGWELAEVGLNNFYFKRPR